MTGIGQESVVEHARRVLEPILVRDGYELVDVEWVRGGGRWTLRVFIDREAGVNVDDCQLVSRTIEPVLVRDGYELVEVEWLRAGGRWTLRLFIDRPGGVNIDDCQLVSRTLEPILDVEDLIEPAYDLEVSSPGLDRPLRKPEHFARYAGQRVQVKAYGPIAGTAEASAPRKSWTGRLEGYRDGAVLVDVDGVLHRIPHDQIAKAHLEYDVEADLRRKD